MTEINDNKSTQKDVQFGEEINMDQCGFSFRPIIGLEIEIDDTVYMYSDDGNLEITLSGGILEKDKSIAEMNDTLAADFLAHVDRYELIEAGTDVIQDMRGFLNEIHYVDAEEEGIGQALICSPSLNHYFFLLVIASSDYWAIKGQLIFDLLKETIQFHSQSTSNAAQKEMSSYSDLTVETYEKIEPDEEFLLTIEKGDISFLLAARTHTEADTVAVTQINAPDGTQLYFFDPEGGNFTSEIFEKPLIGNLGEVCIYYPCDNQHPLIPGTYSFTFETHSGTGVQEVQVILRSGRITDRQSIDLNIWLAVTDDRLFEQDYIDNLEIELIKVLKEKLGPFNLRSGRIEFFNPAMDELEAFSSINIQTDLADCSYMISENINNKRALNLGLVDLIYDESPEKNSNIKAISSGSPGMIMANTSPQSCILLQWPAFQGDINRLADSIIEQLIIFSGIETHGTQSQESPHLCMNHEIAWRIRRHPLFYEPD